MSTFLGYRRADGSVGIRNHLAVIASSAAANQVARRISRQIPEAVAVVHQHGQNQYGEDARQTLRVLRGTGLNPNVGAVLVIGLGNETVTAGEVAEEIRKSGKPVEIVEILAEKGALQAIAAGKEKAMRLVRQLAGVKREPCDCSELIVGLECGGSDFTSGLVSNPAVGAAVDLIVRDGGTAVLSETTELIGAEHILARRAVNPAVSRQLLEIVEQYERRVKATGFDMRGGNPSPGNIAGGLTTIEEKSLGCLAKAGSTPLQAVIGYAEPVRHKGLVFMDTPGNDVESVSALVAGGAQIILFTTGRGTPTGNPVAPVIKITGNRRAATKMADNIDIDASGILTGEQTINEAGEKIYRLILAVAGGKQVKAEILGHQEFAIHRIGLTL